MTAAIAAVARQMPVAADDAVQREVLDYITGRYQGMLREQGYAHGPVLAVLNAQGANPSLAEGTLAGLVSWMERPDWGSLLDSYARCVRITRKLDTVYAVEPDCFVEAATRDLWRAACEARDAVQATPTLDTLMTTLQALQPAIVRFFDDVLVMADDEALRQNRLGLLQVISALPQGIVDLTVMEGF